MLKGYISWQQKDWNQAISHFLNAKEIAEFNENKADIRLNFDHLSLKLYLCSFD